jgi:HK97 family phage portal protein
MGAATLRGNACSLIIPTGGSAVGELMPLQSDRLTIVEAKDGRRAYRYLPDIGKEIIYLQDEIFHVSGMSVDGGIAGLSPITYHRETVGASMALREFGSRLFKNGTHIGTIFEHPGKLSPDAREHLKKSLEGGFSSVVNAGKTLIAEEGMKIAKLGMTSEDAQYLETRKFTRNEIASIFRVPPHKIGDLERATFSNIEQQSIEFVTDSLMPWLVRIEQAISRDLISEKDRKRGFFAEFNVMGLLRGDADARAKYYKARFETGSLTPNQIRALENENPENGGDTCFVPLNMIPIELAGKQNDTNAGGNEA